MNKSCVNESFFTLIDTKSKEKSTLEWFRTKNKFFYDKEREKTQSTSQIGS